MEAPEVERYKLWPAQADRAAFVGVIDPSATPPEVPSAVLQAGTVRAAVDAHAFFKERIERRVCPPAGFDQLKLEKLFEALKSGLAVVSIELEGEDDPQTIFETLNSRGVDLTAGDLMRNFVFQRAKGLGEAAGVLNVDRLYNKYWLPLDGWFWQERDTRGRLNRPRLDWLLVDHLSMHLADFVSADKLYERYRRWILSERPFGSIEVELQSVQASAQVHRRLAEQSKNDVLGRFGIFARAFDTSTAMPLVLHLATSFSDQTELEAALGVIESYILRRDICGIPTAGSNRTFIEALAKLRVSSGDVDALRSIFAAGQGDATRWPNDSDFKAGWLSREQYRGNRQARLRYVFEAIEKAKRSTLNEVVEIKTHLTLEHIMPVKWKANWPLLEEAGEDGSIEYLIAETARNSHLHRIGNLTLLTAALNPSISNGSFTAKLPHLKAQSALALNRELHNYDAWDEAAIDLRGAYLFETAKQVWPGPPAINQ